VVSSVAGISREKCDKALISGMITYNYEIASRAHIQVKDGDVISLRGFGKFLLKLTGQISKKGKIRIVAFKYI
jgi:RNA-binding protein YlmH